MEPVSIPNMRQNTLFCKDEQMKENRNWRRFSSSEKDAHQSHGLPMKQSFYGKYSVTVENAGFILPVTAERT